jgi:hypothetical protein
LLPNQLGDHQHRDLGEEGAQARDQHHRLGERVGEDHGLAAQTQAAVAQGLATQVEAEGQGYTAPAPVDRLE